MDVSAIAGVFGAGKKRRNTNKPGKHYKFMFHYFYMF